MPTKNITVTPYEGSILTVALLTQDPTLLLNAFGEPTSGTLGDNDGTLSNSDMGTSTFNGQSLQYLGMGTVQPGTEVAGVVVPVGAPKPVVVFNAGGQSYFYYPEGEPNELSAVVAVLDVSPQPVEIFPNPFKGTDARDVFVGDGFGNLMTGGAGDDSIRGGGGDDRIAANIGNDLVFGDVGNDVIDAGADNDAVFGGTGADALTGGLGIDTVRYDDSLGGVTVDLLLGTGLRADAAGDTIVGFENVTASNFDDVVKGSALNNKISGLGGYDVLDGGSGNDQLLGGEGGDTLRGGIGEDILFGDALDDVLEGGADADQLTGGTGNDSLNGGTGADSLQGSAGSDRFIFHDAAARDVVLDFDVAADVLALNDAFWGGGLTAAEVVSKYARLVGTDTVFDFGSTEVVLKNVTTLAGLADQIDFI